MSVVEDFLSDERSNDVGHFAATVVRFMVKPLSTNWLRRLLHQLRCAGD
jgi:hypothetical protein